MLFGEFLLSRRAVTPKQLSEALAVQRRRQTAVSTIAVEMNYVPKEKELALHECLREKMREAAVEALIEFGFADPEITAILDAHDRSVESVGMILAELGHLDSTMLVSELRAFKDSKS